MINLKIKSNKSEAIYDILVKVLNIADNYYEKESFVYHHSVCNHEIKEFKLKPGKRNNSKARWAFKISESNNIIQLKNPETLDQNEILEAKTSQNKLQHVINYMLNN